MPDIKDEFKDEFEEYIEPVDEKILRGDTTDDDQGDNDDDDEALSEVEKLQADTAAGKDLEADAGTAGQDDGKQQAEAKKEERSQHIPRERFDEVNTKLKEERAARESLEARLAALEKPFVQPDDETSQGAGAAKPVDLKSMLKEYNAAIMDGDEDLALALAETIENERYRRAEEAAERKTDARLSEREQQKTVQEAQATFTRTVASIISQYPQLDATAEGRDQEAIDEVVEWRDFYYAKSGDLSDALTKAVGKVMKGFTPPAAREDKRKAEQARINADTANRQPPPLSGTGNRSMDVKPRVPDGKDEYEKLDKKIFPDLKVGLLHGKLKSAEKDDVMKKFASGDLDLLVSTTVVEVGVDVPNATIMMIEGAERFGLAQLYQLRGRVGRSEKQSFCFLFSESSSPFSKQRLEALLKAENSFELAEMDLEIRGPGEFLGQMQSGMPDSAMLALQNPELLKSTKDIAEKIFSEDPELTTHPAIKKRLDQFGEEIHLE